MLLRVSRQMLLRQSSFTSKMFHLASLLLIIFKAKSVAPFKKNYFPFFLIYVVFITLSLFKCHCFIFNFRFYPNMHISKRGVIFRETLKSELVVENPLLSFWFNFRTCQMSKSFAASSKSLLVQFSIFPNGHFNDRFTKFSNKQGGFLPKI